MKKSIFLFFAAILCAMSISAANMKGGEVLYLKPNSNWTSSNAWFAMFLCNGTSGDEWVKMTKSGDYYMATVPTGDYKNVIFCRMNNANTTKLDWSNKWNQTADLSFDQNKNCCTITGWDKSSSWGTYQPVSNASLTSSATNIFVGGQATLTAKLSSNTNVNTLKSTSYAISPNTGASISGNTFTATAEGTYTVTATVTYYPNGCTGLTSGLKTATATTTIVAEVPAEEVHDVTVSYLCGSTKVADPTTVNTVGVETPVKVTAPEIAKYTFANWTLGADVTTTDALTSNEINITTKAGGSDFTLVANYEKAKLTYTVTVPAGTENCYLVGAMNDWDVENPIEMTKQGENVFTTTLEGVAITDEYKYISQKGSWDYADVQESNRTWRANDVVTAWKDPLATKIYLKGGMNNWEEKNEFKKESASANVAFVTVTLEEKETYEFKIHKKESDQWYTYGTEIKASITDKTFSTNGGNAKLTTSVAGDYTFKWAINTNKLSVTYPTICAITATANDDAMGTITGAGEYGKGSTATLTATPNDGYLFVNWTKGGEVVATTQEYSFKVTEAVALVANFEAAPEEVHNVTVSYVCGGNKIADDQTVAAVGVTTPQTAKAPEIWGYTFSSWTLGAGVTSADATANPISINTIASGSDFTLTANYTEIPKVKIYVVNNKKWSKVNVYGWKDGEAQGTPAWPGQDITANKETEQVAGFDVYSYSVVPGSYDNLILNNGSDKTEDYKWTDGKYYYVGAAKNYAGGTKEEVQDALVDYYTVVGSKEILGTEWDCANNNNRLVKQGDNSYKLVKENVELPANTYVWKIAKNGTWWDEPDFNKQNNEINITTAGLYNITFTMSSDLKTATATPKLISESEDIFATGYVSGNATLTGGAGWQGNEFEMEYDKSSKTYTCTLSNLQINKEYELKVVIGSTWYNYDNLVTPIHSGVTKGNDGGIAFEMETAGNVIVKYNAETGITITGNFHVPVPYDYYIAWSANNWKGNDEDYGMSDDDENGIYEKVLSLSAGDYDFKIVTPDGWYGNPGKFERAESGNAWTFRLKKEDKPEEDEANARIYADVAGDYTFAWDKANKKLTITYPELPDFSKQSTTIYFRPSADWKQANPRFAAYFFGASAEQWAEMTDNDGDGIYEVNNTKTHLSVKFCRLDPEKADYDWTNTVWNQSSNCAIPSTVENCWVVKNGEWDGATGTWAMPLSSGDNSAAIDAAEAEGQTVTALVNRSLVKDDGYYTLCVPFNMPASLVGKAYQISGLIQKTTDYVEVNLAESRTINAGAPYLIEPSETKDYLLVENVTIVKTTGESIAKSISGLSVAMQGVINGDGTTDGLYWVGNGGYLYNDDVTKSGLRTYFNITTSSGIAPRMRVVAGENVETGIDNIVTADTPVKVIENGQLIIIRDGVKYNVQGQVIR